MNSPLDIQNYRQYLTYIKYWDMLSDTQKDELKIWYRQYYKLHRDKEQQRFREYYHRKKR